MFLQSFTRLNSHILTSNKWNAERKDMICSKKKFIKSHLFTNCSFWLTAFVKHAMIKKKKKLFVFICVFGVKPSTTVQLVLGHSNLAKKKKSWLVESLNLNCHLTLSTNSTHKHDEPWLQLHAHNQIHWHQSSYWQIPFRSLKEKDTELCDTDCNMTALLPVICKYVCCQTVKPGSGGVKMPSLRCLFLAFKNTCWLSQWK